MSRIETVTRPFTPELSQSMQPSSREMSPVSARAIRTGITQISGLRSGIIPFEITKGNPQRNLRELNSPRRERRGSGGRCRRMRKHEYGGCGSPNCHAPRPLSKNTTTTGRADTFNNSSLTIISRRKAA